MANSRKGEEEERTALTYLLTNGAIRPSSSLKNKHKDQLAYSSVCTFRRKYRIMDT
jgi:hypothetical protein